MTSTTEHENAELLARYVEGHTDAAVSASVEAHLLGCPSCRAVVAGLVGPVVDPVWSRVRAEIAAPRHSVLIRALQRCGLRAGDAALLDASRSLHGPWALASFLLTASAALASWSGSVHGLIAYLTIAPLVPVLGVVAAFALPGFLADLTATAPYSMLRLALLRTVAVVVATVPVSVVVGAVIPGVGLLALAWLTPALVLCLLALVAMTWWPPRAAAIGVIVLWLTVVVLCAGADGVTTALGPPAQLVYLVAAAAAAVLLVARVRSSHAPGGTA